eukprot:PhF_6_TR7351/c0_g1_i1/m.11050
MTTKGRLTKNEVELLKEMALEKAPGETIKDFSKRVQINILKTLNVERDLKQIVNYYSKWKHKTYNNTDGSLERTPNANNRDSVMVSHSPQESSSLKKTSTVNETSLLYCGMEKVLGLHLMTPLEAVDYMRELDDFVKDLMLRKEMSQEETVSYVMEEYPETRVLSETPKVLSEFLGLVHSARRDFGDEGLKLLAFSGV